MIECVLMWSGGQKVKAACAHLDKFKGVVGLRDLDLLRALLRQALQQGQVQQLLHLLRAC